MNIDERLEALTHSVELLAEMHKDNEKRMGARMDATDKQITRLGKYVRAVAQLVLDHEARLRRVEDNGNEEAEEEE